MLLTTIVFSRPLLAEEVAKSAVWMLQQPDKISIKALDVVPSARGDRWMARPAGPSTPPAPAIMPPRPSGRVESIRRWLAAFASPPAPPG